MAYLITEDTNFLQDFVSQKQTDCGFGYKAFAASRKMILFDEKKFKESKKKFVDTVITPISSGSGGKIKMGRYFVFKVSDIKTMLEGSCDCDYVQIHNRLDEQGYHKMVILPYKSTDDTGIEKRVQTQSLLNTTIVLEGLPCPPHPNCPFE